MKRYYHATECIFDFIAASGPQELYTLNVECSNQCTEPAFAPENMVADHHNATNGAIHALTKAGLLETIATDHVIYYDLTWDGYDILSQYSDRQRSYETHKRATLG